MRKILTICLLALTLSSCAGMFEPQMFGMSESKFKSLTPKQQQMVIKSYNEREKIRAENEAINHAISAATLVGTSITNHDRD